MIMDHHPTLSKTHIDFHYLSFFKRNRIEIPSLHPWYIAGQKVITKFK